MSVFLHSVEHCDNHPAWSGAFASRLRGALSNSSILQYLSTELEDEANCAKVWRAIQSKLSTADVKIARMSQDWHDLFGLKCEDMDSFLSFYSSSKKILHKLKKSKSIAVTDNVFLKSYFAKVIQTPELQHEVKNLLKGDKASYGAILEMIASDYNAQSTNESMRDGAYKPQSILRRAGTKSSSEQDSEEITIPKKKWSVFPNNTNQLLPSHYYSQFKAWYE